MEPCGALWSLAEPCGALWSVVEPCGLWRLASRRGRVNASAVLHYLIGPVRVHIAWPQVELHLNMDMRPMRLVFLTIKLLYLAHVLACGWYLVADLSHSRGPDGESPTWVTTYVDNAATASLKVSRSLVACATCELRTQWLHTREHNDANASQIARSRATRRQARWPVLCLPPPRHARARTVVLCAAEQTKYLWSLYWTLTTLTTVGCAFSAPFHGKRVQQACGTAGGGWSVGCAQAWRMLLLSRLAVVRLELCRHASPASVAHGADTGVVT